MEKCGKVLVAAISDIHADLLVGVHRPDIELIRQVPESIRSRPKEDSQLVAVLPELSFHILQALPDKAPVAHIRIGVNQQVGFKDVEQEGRSVSPAGSNQRRMIAQAQVALEPNYLNLLFHQESRQLIR